MRAHRGLQGWLETGAEGPAFVAVLVCAVARSAQFYSGGAFNLTRTLGPVGAHVFDIITGLGLATGAELLMSIAGRAWQRYEAEIREVQGRRGLTRAERAALAAHYQFKARWSKSFCAVGMLGSGIGAMSFLLSANPDHSLGSWVGEGLATALLVLVPFYLAVVKEQVDADPAKEAAEQALRIRASVTQEAGARIAAGQFTPQDVRVVAEGLPRAERARFRQVLDAERGDDPLWTAQQIAAWLGTPDDLAMRRKIARRLRQAEDTGQDVRRDERGAYVLARSLAFRLFAEDFLALAGRDPGATRARPAPALRLVPEPVARDTDATQTAVGQA